MAGDDAVAGEVEDVVEMRVGFYEDYFVACGERLAEAEGEVETGEGTADYEDVGGVGGGVVGVAVDEGVDALGEEAEEVG